MRSKQPNWIKEGIDGLLSLDLNVSEIGISDEELMYVDDEGKNREEKELLKSLKISLYLNLATCYFNILDYKDSWAACKEALKLDPSSAKGLHLLAKAINHDSTSTIVELREALEGLKRACTLDPSNHEIQQDLAKAKMQILKMSADQSKLNQATTKDSGLRENPKQLLPNQAIVKDSNNNTRTNEKPSGSHNTRGHPGTSAQTKHNVNRPAEALGVAQSVVNQARTTNEMRDNCGNIANAGQRINAGSDVSGQPVDFSAELRQLMRYLLISRELVLSFIRHLGIKEDQPITFNDIIQRAGDFKKMLEVMMVNIRSLRLLLEMN